MARLAPAFGVAGSVVGLVAMLGDGQAAIEAAGLAPEKVIAFGRSIGSLYAIELVRRQPDVAGLILESGIADPSERFLTYADLSAAGVSEDEVRAEVKRRFNHKRALSDYRNPVLSNAAAWLKLHIERDPMGATLFQLDLFKLWSVWLCGLGLTVVANARGVLPWLVPIFGHVIASIVKTTSAAVTRLPSCQNTSERRSRVMPMRSGFTEAELTSAGVVARS